MSGSGDQSYDPLYLRTPLDFRVELPVLGIPVRFATNDRAVLEHIEGVFGHWRGLDPAAMSSSAGLDIKLLVHDGDEGPAGDPALKYRAPDLTQWIVHTRGSFGLADLERLAGFAYVTRELVHGDQARFRVCILHFLVMIILTIEDRTPMHAALVARGDAALLLAGSPGSGKSTLAYAASRAGLEVLGDDSAYVQLEPKRLWGSGPSVLLLDDAAARFPELSGRPTTLFPTGKCKMLVAAGHGVRRTPWVSRARVCVLTRSDGKAYATRIGPEEIREILTRDPAGAGVRFGTRLDQAASWLAAPGGWRLALSNDPDDAIPLIMEMVREIESG